MTTVILKSAPQREFRARDDLQSRGISAEVPIEKRRRRLAKGGTEWTIRPILRGYVAVRQSPALGLALYAMREQSHRRDIVGCVGTMRDGDLDAVRAIDGRELDPDGPQAMTKPKIGSLVTLRSGPFEGWGVRVTALHGNAFSATACGKYPLRLPYTHLHPG